MGGRWCLVRIVALPCTLARVIRGDVLLVTTTPKHVRTWLPKVQTLYGHAGMTNPNSRTTDVIVTTTAHSHPTPPKIRTRRRLDSLASIRRASAKGDVIASQKTRLQQPTAYPTRTMWWKQTVRATSEPSLELQETPTSGDWGRTTRERISGLQVGPMLADAPPTMDAHARAGNCISNVFPFTNQIWWTPGILRFLGNIGYQSQDAIVGAVYAPLENSVSWFARVCIGSAFHKWNWSN